MLSPTNSGAEISSLQSMKRLAWPCNSMDRDAASCRLFLDRGVKHSQLQDNTKEATTFTVTFSMDQSPLDMLVQIVRAGRTDAVLLKEPWPEHTRHVTSENGWATTTTLLQLTATLDNVLIPDPTRTNVWDMASINASEATLTAVKAALPHVVLFFIPTKDVVLAAR